MPESPARFTVQRVMIGVAILTLACAGFVTPFHRLRLANYHRAMAAILEEEATQGELMCMTPKDPEGPYIQAVTALYGAKAGLAQKQVFYHRRLARAYRWAAFRPWLPVTVVPPDGE